MVERYPGIYIGIYVCFLVICGGYGGGWVRETACSGEWRIAGIFALVLDIIMGIDSIYFLVNY